MNQKSKPPDASNGWEQHSTAFIAQAHASVVGVTTLERWSRRLPAGGALADLGCGPGGPRADVFANRGLSLYGIDPAPTLLAAYGSRYPRAQTACESAEETLFFGRTFDAIVAWGLLFLLPPPNQRVVLSGVPRALNIGGRFIFTAPAVACDWLDITTGQPSQSLGAKAYRSELQRLGVTVDAEFDDAGGNHYFDAVRKS